MIHTLTETEIGLLLLWVPSAVAAVALTVRWFRRFHLSEAFSSLVCTTLAGLPGVTLLLEFSMRRAQRWANSTVPHEFEYPTTLLSVLWIIAGPMLFLVGFVLRVVKDEAPAGTSIVQATHVLMWCWSTVIGFLFAASV